MRLRPPGPPGRWTDTVTGEHGDLLDLIGHRISAGSLGPAIVLTPEGGDFNDDLAALGAPALAARLAPLTGPGPWAAPATPRARNGARQVP